MIGFQMFPPVLGNSSPLLFLAEVIVDLRIISVTKRET
jgi:hypothetical protein